MKDIVADEGIIASGYDNEYGEYSRIYQFAKCFIFHPSSGLFSCPAAMADGAAKTFKVLFQFQILFNELEFLLKVNETFRIHKNTNKCIRG